MFSQCSLQFREATSPVLCVQRRVIHIVDCNFLGLSLLLAKAFDYEGTDIPCALYNSPRRHIKSLVDKEAHPCACIPSILREEKVEGFGYWIVGS